ncbi:uncharacterized protein [Elaeis guineensis]|uniref:uncharacterized protein isoform X9 n=1 Tax=Elaeis guineensis var. tenera TaxID=51953 RepID=UPI003C6CF3D9
MRGLVSDADLGFGDRAIPAAGAAVLVNLLDVAETSLLAHAPGVPYNLSQQHAIGTFGCYSIVQPGWNPCFRVILSSWLFLVQSNTRCIQQGRRQVGIYLPCYDVLCNWLKG